MKQLKVALFSIAVVCCSRSLYGQVDLAIGQQITRTVILSGSEEETTRTYTISTVTPVANTNQVLITGTFSFEYPGTANGAFVGIYSQTVESSGQRIKINGVGTDESPQGVTTPSVSGWIRETDGDTNDVIAVLTTTDDSGNSAEDESTYEIP